MNPPTLRLQKHASESGRLAPAAIPGRHPQRDRAALPARWFHWAAQTTLLWALLLLAGFNAQAGTLTSNFNVDLGIPAGTAIVENGVLKLTINDVNQKGSYLFTDIDNGARVGSFRAAFKARIGGGTSRPAQGFSFVFANDLSLDTAFGEGGGNTKGLVISFDVADNNAGFGAEGNAPGDAPGVIVKLGGFKVAAKKADNLVTGDRMVDVIVQLDADGTLDVSYDGVKIFDNFAFAYTPIAGVFGFGAATSDLTAALNAHHWIDDVNITTTPISGAYVSSATPPAQGARPDAVVSIQIENLASQTVQMTFNGQNVSPTVNRSGTTTTITYDPPGLLAANSKHSVRLTYEGNRTFSQDFQVINYPTIPATAVLAGASVNTAASGFKTRVYQVVSPPPSSVAAAEKQLAGLSGANIADLTLAAPDKTFTLQTVNMDQDAAGTGNFPIDNFIPGMPGVTPDGNISSDNFVAEMIAYLDLKAGAHTFGVNSDDGFRLTAGSDPRDVTAQTIGVFDGARGSADTIFSFVVEQDGIYAFRLVWFEIGGGANVEFFSVNANGDKTLINDRTAAGHIKAYSERSAAFKAAPYVSAASPAPRETDVKTRPKLEISITEDATVLDASSIQLKLNGNAVTATSSKSGKVTTLSHQVSGNLSAVSPQTVELSYKDNGGNTVTRTWSFTTGKSGGGFVSTVKGYWNFEGGNLKAIVGNDLQLVDTSVASHYVFGTTGTGPLAGIPNINGQPAKVLGIPFTSDVELERKLGLKVKHGISPNGGGSMVNQWTLIVDLLWVNEGRGFGTILRTHDLDKPIDGDLFWRASDGSYGKGCCSNYDGISQEQGKNHKNNEWARVVLTVDLASSPRVLGKFVNGFKHRDDVTGDGNALDSRFALPAEFIMFQDGDDNEQSSAYISALQVREGRMTDEEIATLGGPSARGIPIPGPVAGQWDFDKGDLTATFGQDLQLFDSSVASHYVFGTTGSGQLADIPSINGQPAKVLLIPFTSDVELERKLGLRVNHGITPNGGGKLVNQWTLIMDLLWINEGRGFGTLLRTHDIEQPIDGDMFWRASDGSYGKGCCSNYDGISQDPGKNHKDREWARVVFTVDLASSPRVFGKYVNGFKHRDDVGGDGNALDSRFALPPQFIMFQDGDDNEQSTVAINSMQIREGRLTDEEIAALGGPSANGIPSPQPIAVRGQWDFDGGNLKATIGNDLQLFDNSVSSHYVYGTTGTGNLADIPNIGGQPAKVIGIPFTSDVELERKLGLRLQHGISPNGGGKMVNQWTLIFDLLWINEGRGFGTILRTHDIDKPIDGDLFWRASDGSYGKGCCSNYDGISQEPGKNHKDREWARVVFTVDLASSPRVFGKYINGFKHRDDVGGDGNALDSRFALPPEIILFQDGDDNEQSTAYINSIQIREGRMSDEEIAALGGPTASGIPAQISTSEPPAPVAPKITFGRVGGNVVISWAATATGFTLESTDSLRSPNWAPVTGVANNSVSVALGAGARFYRLRR